jgi:hypothetical protein
VGKSGPSGFIGEVVDTGVSQQSTDPADEATLWLKDLDVF